MAKLQAYIIVFIVHDADTKIAFKEFEKEGLTGYPYFYIGVDAWFDTGRILNNNVSNYTQGFIGTVPWQTDAMPLESYDNDLQPTINESMTIYHNLINSWEEYYNNGYQKELYNLQIPSSTAIYGYDAMYTLARALHKYLEDTPITDDGYINITKLNDIIINNEIAFIGASGHIKFDQNGDRSDGLYAFGNAGENGYVSYFGYFYQDGDNLTLMVDYDNITWPKYFVERGIEPRSGIKTTERIQDISQHVRTPLYIFCCLSLVITLIYASLTWHYHTNRVLRAASWRINLVMCVGCLFGYISIIIYGVDEHWVNAGPSFTFLCNFRLWLWILSYTLLFMPLFMKTYRLSRIFSEILEKKHLSDTKLLKGIGICITVDLLLLTIYTSIEPLQRLYIEGELKPIDELQETQYMYGSCETTNGTQYIYYALIALWKAIETLFGLYCALSVSRVGRKELTQFDETTQQLLSILFLFIALCVALPVGALGPSTNPSFYYGVIGVLTLSVGNVTTTLNMLPRLWALVRGNAEEKFSQSADEKLEDMIVDKLRKIGIDEQWWKKASTVDQTTEVFRANSNKKKNRRFDVSEDNSTVQLAIPTQSGQSGMTSTTSITIRGVNNDDIDEDDDDEVDSDIREQQERELNKKSSETPINSNGAAMTPLSTHMDLQSPHSQTVHSQSPPITNNIND